MGSHVLRPLFVVVGLVALVLIARIFVVPEDFGVGARGYMYGWHRPGNEEDWKNFTVKYRTAEYCNGCHADKYTSIGQSAHAAISCENCHGPAGEHPSDPPKLAIDRSREQCLRCHYPLPYAASGRGGIRGVDPGQHNPGVECSACHNPHHPSLEGLK
ncbi:MAG: multiheme c-type cytochrome [Nitrospirota bacterium]